MQEMKIDRCEMCGKIGGIGVTQDTSGGHILCYECSKIAEQEKLIVIDCDGLWYDIETTKGLLLTRYLDSIKSFENYWEQMGVN